MQKMEAKSKNKTRRYTLTIIYKIWEAYYYYNIDALYLCIAIHVGLHTNTNKCKRTVLIPRPSYVYANIDIMLLKLSERHLL